MQVTVLGEVRVVGLLILLAIISLGTVACSQQKCLGTVPGKSANKYQLVQVTVLGEVKIVGLLILSAIILPGESSQFTAKMTVGCVLAMLGFCLYSNTKLVMARRAAAGQAQTQKQSSDVEEGKPLLQVSSRDIMVAVKYASPPMLGTTRVCYQEAQPSSSDPEDVRRKPCTGDAWHPCSYGVQYAHYISEDELMSHPS